MQQQEFGLFECYIMAACRGMKAIINNGELEGFVKEDSEEDMPEAGRAANG